MITAFDCGSGSLRQLRYRLSSLIGTITGFFGSYVPIEIWRRIACLYVRRKWRSDSGPVLRMPEYLSFHATIFSVPFGWMRGSSSSSPMISASSCRLISTSSRWSPGRSPASPAPGCSSPSWPSESPTSPSPCPTPPCCLSPCLKCGMSTDGIGIATVSFPFFAIISPCEMYLRRFCLIFPRMIWRNRPWSRSIFWLIRTPHPRHRRVR